jgi:hypothetical protein
MSNKLTKVGDSIEGCLNTVGIVTIVVLVVVSAIFFLAQYTPVSALPIGAGIILIAYLFPKYRAEIKRRLAYPLFVLLVVLCATIILFGLGIIFGVFKKAMF